MGNGEWRERLGATLVLIAGAGGRVTGDGFNRCLPAAFCCNRRFRRLALRAAFLYAGGIGGLWGMGNGEWGRVAIAWFNNKKYAKIAYFHCVLLTFVV